MCLKTQLSFAFSALKGIALRSLDQSILTNVQTMESAVEMHWNAQVRECVHLVILNALIIHA